MPLPFFFSFVSPSQVVVVYSCRASGPVVLLGGVSQAQLALSSQSDVTLDVQALSIIIIIVIPSNNESTAAAMLLQARACD